jgi:hypothetical protein
MYLHVDNCECFAGPLSAEVLSILRNSILILGNFSLALDDAPYTASDIQSVSRYVHKWLSFVSILHRSWQYKDTADVTSDFPTAGIIGIVLALLLGSLCVFIYFMHRKYSSQTRVIPNRVRPSSNYYAAPRPSVVSSANDDYATLPHQPVPHFALDLQRRTSAVSAKDVELNALPAEKFSKVVES